MKIEGNTVTFSSGNVLYANHGIIGLSPSLDITEGYDSGFWHKEMLDPPATTEDIAELCDYMSVLWQQMKASL